MTRELSGDTVTGVILVLMGERVNGWWIKEIGWLTAGIMAVAGIATIVSLL